MRNLWQYRELQSEIRTRFLAELRRELEALLIYGPLSAVPQVERSPEVNLLLVSGYPDAIRDRAVRIAHEIDEKYETDTEVVALTPAKLLDTPWKDSAPPKVLLQKGIILHGESAVLDYRAELRRARQPS